MKFLGTLLSFLMIGCLADSSNDVMRRFVRRDTKNSTVASAPIPTNSPLDVGVTLYILDVSDFDIDKMEYTMQMYFRQIWVDPRLPQYLERELKREHVRLGNGKAWILNDLDNIWKPDLFFIEERRASDHDLMLSNNFLRIKDSGYIMQSKRVTLTFGCPMHFGSFPHDRQHCNISIESYGFTSDQMNLKWDKGLAGIGMSDSANASLPDYIVLPMTINRSHVSLSSGNYTRLVITISFERRIGFFLTKLYLPYIFLVLVTGLTFWIDPKLVSVRLGILLTVLMIMLSLAFQIDFYTPVTSYTKAIDVWVGYCLTSAFAALLEYVFICYIEKKHNISAKNKGINDVHIMIEERDNLKNDKNGDIEGNATKYVARNLCQAHLWNIHIDIVFRYLYPLLFAVFNLIYWCAYAS